MTQARFILLGAILLDSILICMITALVGMNVENHLALAEHRAYADGQRAEIDRTLAQTTEKVNLQMGAMGSVLAHLRTVERVDVEQTRLIGTLNDLLDPATRWPELAVQEEQP